MLVGLYATSGFMKHPNSVSTKPAAGQPAGISDATFYNWRKKHAGLMPSEMKRLRQLEEENASSSATRFPPR